METRYDTEPTTTKKIAKILLYEKWCCLILKMMNRAIKHKRTKTVTKYRKRIIYNVCTDSSMILGWICRSVIFLMVDIICETFSVSVYSGWIAFYPDIKWNLCVCSVYELFIYQFQQTGQIVNIFISFACTKCSTSYICMITERRESTVLDNVRLSMTFSSFSSTFQSKKRFYIEKWVIFNFFVGPMND